MKLKLALALTLATALSVCTAFAITQQAKEKAQLSNAAQQDQPAPPRQLSEKERQRRAKSLRKEGDPFAKWVEVDVAYIITDEERQAFKRLQNAEEREQFIEQFWLRRDPSSGSGENEYKEEHYRRMAYANEHFASGVPGWKTDRGRIYITFGPPDEIEAHPSGGTYQRPAEEGGGSTSTFPFEKWRYRNITDVGQDVVIEFVDPTMSGEYRITIDPNEKDALLHVPGAGPTLLEQMGMMNKADRIGNPDASAQAFGGAPSRTNQFELLERQAKLMRPPALHPELKELKELVESDVKFNVFPFQVRADYIKITSDTVLTALTVQMNVRDMSFQKKDDLQHAVINIFGRVKTLTGRVAQTFEDVVNLDIPAGQLQASLDQQRVYWQAMPLHSGLYRVDIALKDVYSDNKGTYSMALRVPSYDDETLSASSLIVADQIQKVGTQQVSKGQFVIGSTKVRPSVGERFSRNSDVGIYLQVYNLQTDTKTHKPNATVGYALLGENNKPVWQYTETSAQIQNAGQQMTLEKLLPLRGIAPGKYKLQVKITDELAKASIAPSTTITVQ